MIQVQIGDDNCEVMRSTASQKERNDEAMNACLEKKKWVA